MSKMAHKAVFYIFLAMAGLTTLTACNNSSKFDRKKWAYTDGLEYPLRDDIVDDLMQNHHIKGLTFDQVIDSLGSPQRRDPLKFTYQLLDNSFQYQLKKPVHKKSLIVYFSKDSVANRFEIYEFTAKEKKKK